jgi:hypothetical protein
MGIWRSMGRFTSLWPTAKWVLAAATLAVGVYLLVLSWGTYYQFGLSRGLGYPRVSHEEIAFWYVLPGFQAGLLLGLLLALAGRGIGRLLVVLNLVVWAAIVVYALIIFWLISRGAMF